ncbi:MAG TPA: hypothetical protein VFR75_09570 [Solirubrobacterales bacterium]|nr:hypothetical protein [Solirubrobacterales bacterium]
MGATEQRHGEREVGSEWSARREELALTEAEAATEEIPEDRLQEFRSPSDSVLGQEIHLIDRADLPVSEDPGQAGNRPPWLAQTYLPRAAPALVSADALSGLADRPLPMSLLSHLPDLELFDRSYPFSAIGRVFVGTDPTVNDRNWPTLFTHYGSGALVGRNLLVTASHLAPWDRPPGQWWMRFVPAYWGAIRGSGFTEPFGGSFVEHFTGVKINIDDVNGRDLVICKLYRPLGDVTGWFGHWRWFDDDEYKNWPYTSVGYPENPYLGERPVLVPFAAVEDVEPDGDGRELETHPFASDGWSGGPLYFWRNQQPLVVGVCSGIEKRQSVFSGGPRLLDLVAFGLSSWS